jgi:hypothetical protein
MNSWCLGVLVEYDGMVGTVTFVDNHYITVCTKPKEDGMHGPVCLVVYPHQWDSVNVLNSHHS